ncbi:MAG: PEP-CTERM sorting domain-containing protein [Phycisphaerales bacterium]|nr:MAG: PEP-CTERM sorting domain-containing protein [Phycisphaerales bacterium]
MTRPPLLPALAVILLLAPLTYAAAIDISAYAWTDSPGGLSAIAPGDAVYYQVGVAVDPEFDPPGGSVGNRGLATLVYDMISLEAEAQGIPIDTSWWAWSGYANWTTQPVLRHIEYGMFKAGDGSGPAYDGGWGYATSGVPPGGNPYARPGSLLGVAAVMSLTWEADVDPLFPGLQPFARLGVGHEPYTFPDLDPILSGLQGGLGMSISDPDNIVEGDGTWVVYRGLIDTDAWAPGTYNYDLIPTNGALLSGTADYNQDLGGGFRVAVYPEDMSGDSFAFTIIPEPPTAMLLLLAAAAVSRRRRV